MAAIHQKCLEFTSTENLAPQKSICSAVLEESEHAELTYTNSTMDCVEFDNLSRRSLRKCKDLQ